MDKPTMTRRSFVTVLGAAGLTAAAAGSASATVRSTSPTPDLSVTGARRTDGGLRFVMLTDTHADVDAPTNLSNLARIFTAVRDERPRFVLNCGDITEYGPDAEFAAYRDTIPDDLFDKIRHVPGNHEARWDPSAREAYRRWFGDPQYSFDADGIHFVALDPTQILQEPGLYGPGSLSWLHDDLSAAGAQTPSVLFQHYPVAGRNCFVNDADALLETISPFSVRAFLAGHIHREETNRLNGLTEFTGTTSKGQPVYYVIDRAVTADGVDALLIQRVTLPAPSSSEAPVRQDLLVVPLGRTGPGDDLSPTQARCRPSVDTSGVDVTVDSTKAAVAARARIYPQGVFGGTDDTGWVTLSLDAHSPSRWSGSLPVAGLAPGAHRIQVRVDDASGAAFETTVNLDNATSGPDSARPAWKCDLAGPVQGALAERDGLVVAATASGTVAALQPQARSAQELWRAAIGPVFRGPAFTLDGQTLLVPSADHHLHALDAGSGARRWRVDLGRPVLSAPVVGAVNKEEVVAISAGDRLALLDVTDGRMRWNIPIPVMSAGKPAIDGERVIIGGGDGKAHAYDAMTGTHLWSFTTNTRSSAYSRLIYGPWDDTIELLPGGGVLVATVSGAWALDRATGAQRWTRKGSYVYSPGLAVSHSDMLVVDEQGRASRLDTGTGQAAWTSPTAPRVLNSGPVLAPHGRHAWVVGTGGLLVEVELATGRATPLRQLFTANTFSTPVVVDDQLVVAAQDGIVRGVEIPT